MILSLRSSIQDADPLFLFYYFPFLFIFYTLFFYRDKIPFNFWSAEGSLRKFHQNLLPLHHDLRSFGSTRKLPVCTFTIAVNFRSAEGLLRLRHNLRSLGSKPKLPVYTFTIAVNFRPAEGSLRTLRSEFERGLWGLSWLLAAGLAVVMEAAKQTVAIVAIIVDVFVGCRSSLNVN